MKNTTSNLIDSIKKVLRGSDLLKNLIIEITASQKPLPLKKIDSEQIEKIDKTGYFRISWESENHSIEEYENLLTCLRAFPVQIIFSQGTRNTTDEDGYRIVLSKKELFIKKSTEFEFKSEAVFKKALYPVPVIA